MKKLPKLGRSVVGVVAMSVLAVLAYGSAGPARVYTTNYSPVQIPYGTLVNKNLRIESTGNSWGTQWSVDGGEDFRTPFSVYWWSNRVPRNLVNRNNSLLESHGVAYQNGARPVRIHIDGEEEPLYGLIVFNQAIAAAYGPARQSYYVSIPEEKIRRAQNGVTAVAFERMKYKNSWTYDGRPNSQDRKWYSWILWMSRTPLVNEGPAFRREIN